MKPKDPNHPKASYLRAVAWDEGHSSGVIEVYHWIDVLSDFLR